MDQRLIELSIEEAQLIVPKPKLVVFAAFHFDPEATKDIAETNWPGVELLAVQMNADMLTEDLKKKRSSNESFWLVGQPDVRVAKSGRGDEIRYEVSVHGFDYYDPRGGEVISGSEKQIAMWMLDTDYDGRSVYPRQLFFLSDRSKKDWNKLAATLRSEIDLALFENYVGTKSLPFECGDHKRIAVKLVDDRGIESLKVMKLEN